MSRFKGSWPVAALLLLLAIFLALISALLPLKGMEWLIPTPEHTADQLVNALGAHRYTGAMEELSQDLRQQISEQDLQELVKNIEDSPLQGLQNAHGQQSEEHGASGATANATVEVEFGNNQKKLITFPLKKENQVWRVTSIDPLRQR